ncbi:hypothetical protein A0J61_02776 [Choanephora cucurbitarum]|uniref:Uncharacterized protein n=1 Tax=Choanephora cucurbitarum TaxID=101091 RepID=A0A1C7NJH2_9FUNG|nr:hypothetical protein A0J61_02776 [Choanephora cucurbitarum]
MTSSPSSSVYSLTSSSAPPQPLNIPQFVVIHDQINNTYKHPVIHYVFEDEDFPDIPREKLILVDLDPGTQLKSANSYSPEFQVTDCVLEQSPLSDQFEQDTTLFNLTIQGVSTSLVETVEGIPPIKNDDHLKETLFHFKNR